MDSDRISRLQREVALLARQIAGLPVRIAESGGGDPSLPFQLAVVTGVAAEPAYAEAGGGFAIDGTPDTHSGRAILLEEVDLDLAVADLSESALEFNFANAHRDVAIGVGDVIRVWHRDGIPVTAGMLNSPPLYAPIYGEHFNVTDYLRRLAGYDPEADDPPLLLHTTADEIYWQEGEGLVGPQGPQGDPGAPGDQVAEGYCIDLAGTNPKTIHHDAITSAAGTQAVGINPDEFQFWMHDPGATTRDDAMWTTVADYDGAKDQMWWHQSGTFEFNDIADFSAAAACQICFAHFANVWKAKTLTGYDDEKTQLFGHVDDVWQAKTIAEWLNLLPGYVAGDEQEIGHDENGPTEWRAVTGGGKLFSAIAATTINAGTPSSPTSGTATVYDVAADGTTTSLGSMTVWNPFVHKIKGALTVAEIDSENYLVCGYDLLEALAVLTDFGARKYLGTAAGASSPTDIKWQATVKCGEVV